MSLTNFPNGITSFGMPVVPGPAMPFGDGGVGKVYFVNPDTGNDGNRGTDPDRPLASIARAYALCTTNDMDIVVLSADSSHAVDAGGLAITKNRINFVSADFGTRLIQQGAKVTSNSSSDDAAYVMKNTGTRNGFFGIKFIQTSTDASALTCIQDGGEGSVYNRCSFTFGVADNLDGATTYEALLGTDSGTFEDCTFGNDTLLTSAARTVVALDQVTTSQEFKSNIMRNCYFQISSSSTSANFIRVLATDGVKFTNIFDRCIMTNAIVTSIGAAALDNAVESVSGLVEGSLLFYMCAADSTEFCTGVTDRVKTYGPATDATAGEAGTPS